MTFKVKSKKTDIIYEVFSVSHTQFLIYFNDRFEWHDINKFRPIEKTNQEINKRVAPIFKRQINSVQP